MVTLTSLGVAPQALAAMLQGMLLAGGIPLSIGSPTILGTFESIVPCSDLECGCYHPRKLTSERVRALREAGVRDSTRDFRAGVARILYDYLSFSSHPPPPNCPGLPGPCTPGIAHRKLRLSFQLLPYMPPVETLTWAEAYNRNLASLTEQLGPMAGTYTGPYPTLRESIRTLETTGRPLPPTLATTASITLEGSQIPLRPPMTLALANLLALHQDRVRVSMFQETCVIALVYGLGELPGILLFDAASGTPFARYGVLQRDLPRWLYKLALKGTMDLIDKQRNLEKSRAKQARPTK